jgi:hypothetical protein
MAKVRRVPSLNGFALGSAVGEGIGLAPNCSISNSRSAEVALKKSDGGMQAPRARLACEVRRLRPSSYEALTQPKLPKSC